MEVNRRLKNAFEFLESIKDTYHSLTYASYCASPKRLSYGNVTFKVIDGLNNEIAYTKEKNKSLSPEKWILKVDNAKNELVVQNGSQKLRLRLMPANAAGDDTVPSKNLEKCFNKERLFIHGTKDGTDYGHQDSYSNPNVLSSMLYSIIQIAKTAKWT